MMTESSNIEYIGHNITPDGETLEDKVYYFWDSRFSNLVPEQISDVFSPFDYGERKDGEMSVSGFIDDSSVDNIKSIFGFINTWMQSPGCNAVMHQFFSIFNLSERLHYSPILSLKYKDGKLAKISLYVGPLQKKSAMLQYLARTLDIFSMRHCVTIRNVIKCLVESGSCDMYLAAWDMDVVGCTAHKAYVKIKDPDAARAVLKNEVAPLASYIQKEGLRLCVIGFVFVDGALSHYNLYYKPLL